ncbi:MAG: hypothetical protein HZB35_04060 [Nitrospirae bacterium]|nr:hypothetical protein [Nitrospirota bacterium]
MNKLLVVAILIAGGYYGYQHSSLAPKSEVVQTYQKFADHMVRDQFQEAKQYAVGPALQAVETLLQPAPNYGSSPVGLYKSVMSDQAVKKYGRNLTRELAGDVGETAYKVESEQKQSDGQTVKIVAVQQVARFRAGKVQPNISVFRHTVEMKRAAAGWKVQSIQEQPA